eukprot:TRINITY_DN8998_c2_g1_i1.p3 TRINITY_DN8998_c2_g1~~TRINITY_DN8998_c2_g1_i1.p3  ORF type:complete len:131 (-),score=12.11 TRINITY_DN8998_c2_g1_i1:54-446(-)
MWQTLKIYKIVLFQFVFGVKLKGVVGVGYDRRIVWEDVWLEWLSLWRMLCIWFKCAIFLRMLFQEETKYSPWLKNQFCLQELRNIKGINFFQKFLILNFYNQNQKKKKKIFKQKKKKKKLILKKKKKKER